MDNNKMYKVTNRSSCTVSYQIPDGFGFREFAPGQTLEITFDELEKLSYTPGGQNIISKYLLIRDTEVTESLAVHTEPEYYMTEKDIIELLLHGSLDAFLDALDFAPVGVIQIIKDQAVKMKLNDVAKREAILKKTGFDVTKAIQHNAESKEEASNEDSPKRRVQPAAASETTPVRRTAPTQYKIVTPE